MKRKILASLLFLFCIVAMAQPPQGGGRGGMGGGRPPMGQDRPSGVNEKVWLEEFPDIPNLALEQREKVGDLISKEYKNINKQMQKKHELMHKVSPSDGSASSKDLEKNRKKIDKIDSEIEKIKNKTNTQAKKVLDEEQYIVFLEKRSEFRFKHQRMPISGDRSQGEFPQQQTEDRPQGMPPMMDQNFD